jgi:hypothetical protein
MKIKSKSIDLSKVFYLTIMIVVLGISLIGCNKKPLIPAPKYKPSFYSLEDLFNNDFYCYRAEYPDSNTYHFNIAVNNEFLSAFNSPPSEFDLNDDGDINTQDVLLNLTGFGNPQPEYPPFIDFTPFQNFGEGNTWLTYIGNNPNISFGWLHRTPYDEINDPNYIGYEDIYTWTLDVVGANNITYYYFVAV